MASLARSQRTVATGRSPWLRPQSKRNRTPVRTAGRGMVTVLHGISLLAAFGFLVWANRNQWFVADEWNFLVRRRLVGSTDYLGLWDPHNKHWVTLPVLVYRFLFGNLRCQDVRAVYGGAAAVAPDRCTSPLATPASPARRGPARNRGCCRLRVRGRGLAERHGRVPDHVRRRARFSGSVPCSSPAIVTLTPARYACTWLLLIGSLMCSGVGVTMVAVVAVIVLLQTGIKAAVVTASAPCAAYLLWYAVRSKARASRSRRRGSVACAAGDAGVLVAGLDRRGGCRDRVGGRRRGTPRAPRRLDHSARRSVGQRMARRHGARPRRCLVSRPRRARSFRARRGAGASSRYEYVTLALLLPLAAFALDRLLGAEPRSLGGDGPRTRLPSPRQRLDGGSQRRRRRAAANRSRSNVCSQPPSS